jgi:hypothetical protein
LRRELVSHREAIENLQYFNIASRMCTAGNGDEQLGSVLHSPTA